MNKIDIKCVISGEETMGKVAVFEETVAPFSGPPRHAHRDQLEIFHILEGRLRFEVNGKTFEREAGSVSVVPTGVVHAFRNTGSAPVKIRFELFPALNSEEAFALLSSGGIEDVESFFDRYGMDLSGPPLD